MNTSRRGVHRVRILAVVFVLALLLGGTPGAAYYQVWLGGGTNNWQTGAYWNDGVPPNINVGAVICYGRTVHITAAGAECYYLQLGGEGTGFADIASGSLTTHRITIGYEGLLPAASFTQWGGAVSADSDVWVGYSANTDAVYTLSGGTLTANTIYLGHGQTDDGHQRTFNYNAGTLSAGMIHVMGGGRLAVSFNASLTGNIDVDGGTVDFGARTWQHTGGTGLTPCQVDIGPGTVTAGQETFGSTGSTNVTQTSGTNTVSGTMTLGLNGSATYNLQGGRLQSILEVVGGAAGHGYVDHSGGQNVMTGGNLTLSQTADSYGRYDLRGQSSRLEANHLYVGYAGVGLFQHEEGTVALTGDLRMGSLAWGGPNTWQSEYHLFGGSVTARDVHVAEAGKAKVSQFNGTFTVNRDLYMADQAGSVAEYDQRSGLLSVAGDIINGAGTSTFRYSGGGISVGGGSLAVDTFIVDPKISGTATRFTFHSGLTIRTTDTTVGQYGYGMMEQIGGGHQASGTLTVGQEAAAQGEYHVMDASMSAGRLVLGQYGHGFFNSATNSSATIPTIWIASETTGTGEYDTMESASLATTNMDVGRKGVGAFKHYGGTVTVAQALKIGSLVNSEGTYSLWDGQLTMNGPESIGFAGQGTFYQYGGLHQALSGDFKIGRNPGSAGEYHLEGGTLQAAMMNVGYLGTGTFRYRAGQYNVSSTQVASGSSFILEGNLALDAGQWINVSGSLNAGTTHAGAYGLTLAGPSGLYAAGTVDLAYLTVGSAGAATLQMDPAGSIYVKDTLRLALLATLAAPYGGAISARSLEILSQTPADLADLENVTLNLLSGATGYSTLEAAGRRDGGFTDNFALGAVHLNVKAQVQLADAFDNGRRGAGAECVFIDTLTFDKASVLDLNGLWLYVDGNQVSALESHIAGGRLWDSQGGALHAVYDPVHDWTVVPEPATLSLLALGGLVPTLSGLRRRK
ncbi:MAG: PEP-CTERM sorting domain-containing protein [Planctomycetota bacterium]|nr:PEP-CTERM sorting domain-containing protein [Planctomycetota bacterium]